MEFEEREALIQLWKNVRSLDSLDDLAQNKSCENLRKIAESALKGFCFNNLIPKEEKLKEKFSLWVKWMSSDRAATRFWWEWQAKQKSPLLQNRDKYTLLLWESFEKGDNSGFSEWLKNKCIPWSYYQRYFFNWFLDRFHQVNARRVFCNSSWRSRAHWLTAILTIGIIAYYLCHFPSGNWGWWSGLLGGILGIYLLVWPLTGIPFSYYMQSLTPRLGVMTGIGYLFLLSANNLVKIIYVNSLLPLKQFLIGIIALLSVMLYLWLVIHRRVQPPLHPIQSVCRAGGLMLQAAAYSVIGLLICQPLMFSINNLSYLQYDSTKTNVLISHFNIAVIAMALGVLLQLVWVDEPVTKPL